MSDFQTPMWVCKLMVALIDSKHDVILEPTPGNGNLTSALRQAFPTSTILQPTDFFTFDMSSHVDLIVANPPFSPMLKGFEFLRRFKEISDEIIIIIPWLLLINSNSRTKWFVDNGLSDIYHLPRSAFPGSRVQTCIAKFSKKEHHNPPINLHLIHSYTPP